MEQLISMSTRQQQLVAHQRFRGAVRTEHQENNKQAELTTWKAVGITDNKTEKISTC